MISLFPYDYFKTRTALLLEHFRDFWNEDPTWQFVLVKAKITVETLPDNLAQIPEQTFNFLYHLLVPFQAEYLDGQYQIYTSNIAWRKPTVLLFIIPWLTFTVVDNFRYIYANLLEFYKKFLLTIQRNARITVAKYYTNLMRIRRSIQTTHRKNTFYYLDAVVNEQYISEKIKLDVEPEPNPLDMKEQSLGKPIKRREVAKTSLQKLGIIVFSLLITFMYVFINGYARDSFAIQLQRYEQQKKYSDIKRALLVSEHNVNIQLLQLRTQGYTDVDSFTFQDLYRHSPNEVFLETTYRLSEAVQMLEQI